MAMKTYEIRARDIVVYIVTIEAESEEEALERFRNGEYSSRDEHELDRYLDEGGDAATEVKT